MDHENQNINTNPNNPSFAAANNEAHQPIAIADVSQQTSASAQTFDQLMARSPTLSPLCGWLKCLRKPALSMQYSIQKRHVPDLDADACNQGVSSTAQCPPSGQKGQSGQTPSQAPAQAGQNSDVMGLTGGFTIRYFDFAVGILGLSLLGCILKGCSCLKRRIF